MTAGGLAIRRALRAALWLALLSCATYPARGGSAGAPKTRAQLDVRVMSFNVRYGSARDGANSWSKRKGLVFDVIRKGAPDVVGIQEALRFQIDEIRRALGGYGEVGVGRDGGSRGEYSAILYRTARFTVESSGTFWLSETPEVPSRHWGNACVRICTWARLVQKRTGLAFYLFNTHLDHRSQPSREKGVRLIARRMEARAHADPVVLTGDLNAGERNPAVRYLLGDGTLPGEACPVPLVDSFRVLHPGERAVGTFHWFKGLAPGGKIDYVFVQPDAKVLKAEIIRANRDGRYPSDHFPVTARVRLACGAGGGKAPARAAATDKVRELLASHRETADIARADDIDAGVNEALRKDRYTLAEEKRLRKRLDGARSDVKKYTGSNVPYASDYLMKAKAEVEMFQRELARRAGSVDRARRRARLLERARAMLPRE